MEAEKTILTKEVVSMDKHEKKHKERSVMTFFTNAATVIGHANTLRNIGARKSLIEKYGRDSWRSKWGLKFREV